MTTPNEELILKLRGQAYTTCRPDQLCDQAADLLQSQAERIADLEKQHIERLLRIEKEVDVLVAERDELREKYTDTYWALDDAARENTNLRAQLTEIAATEPVAYMVQFSPGSRWVELTKEEFDSDLDGHIVYKKQAFFTRPMPAQDAETGMIKLPEPDDTYCGVNYYTESQLKQAVRDAQGVEDAERYRWLRDYLISPSTHFDDLIVSADKADTLDGVIDAARAKGAK